MLSALTWGVSWSPGYPLYTLLGHLASRWPWGSPAGNVNALSGALHAGALSLFFLALRRMGLERLPSLVAVSLLAFSRLFWYYSQVAEVRALNDLLAMAAAYLAVSWDAGASSGRLAALAAVAGLGLGHHPTFALILPAVLWRVVAREGRPRAGTVLAFAAGTCAFFLLPYAVLGVRLGLAEPAYNPSDARTWGDVADLFLRRDLGGPLRVISGRGLFRDGWDAEALLRHSGWMLSAAARETAAAGLALAAAGLAVLYRADRGLLAFWAAWFLLPASAVVLLGSQQLPAWDPAYQRAVLMRQYSLPFFALFALAGFGVQPLLRRARPAFGYALLAAVAVVLPAVRPIHLRGHDLLRDYAAAVLESAGPSDMIVLGTDDSVFATRYLDLVEGRAGDRVLLVPSLFAYPPYVRRLERRHPGLRLARAEGGLDPDWGAWCRENPSRSLYAEAYLALAAGGPPPRPAGALVRWCGPEPFREAAARTRSFLASPALDSLLRRGVHGFTQELYLLGAYEAALAAHLGFWPRRDPLWEELFRRWGALQARPGARA